MTRVAAAIPAFQAEFSVGGIVRRTRLLIADVLVIDDGSLDRTAEVARQAGARVESLTPNQGKGMALKTAFQILFARGFDTVITLDADGQHLPEEIPRLLEARDTGADLVLGTRDHLFAEMGSLRRVSNRLSSRAISLAAGRPLTDVQTGFRLYTRHLIEATGFPGAHFEAESAVVVRAARAGFKIAAVPVRLGFADGRTTSHYRPLLDSLRIAAAVVQARLEVR
jgi:glycosyltransferase involved in cell wall biosynthesis